MDYLSEDTPIPGQSYCLLSFVSPNSSQKASALGIKIRGTYDTLDEAKHRAQLLRNIDETFDVFVASVGKWLPWYPDHNLMPDVQYQEQELNKIVTGHMEEQIKSKQHFEQRKRDMIEKAVEEGSKEGQAKKADEPLHPVDIITRINNSKELLNEVLTNKEQLEKSIRDLEETLKSFGHDEIQNANDALTQNISEVNKALFDSENVNV